MQWNNRIFFAPKKHLYFHDFICELRVVVSYLEAIVAFSWLSQAQWWCLYSSWMCQCWWYSQGHLYLYLRLSFAHFLFTFVCMYCNIGCCFLLILNGFYYACSFGCHENFKIFVCLFCMITIFIYFSWFCGRGCEQLKSTSEHNDLTVRFMLMKWQKWNAI